MDIFEEVKVILINLDKNGELEEVEDLDILEDSFKEFEGSYDTFTRDIEEIKHYRD